MPLLFEFKTGETEVTAVGGEKGGKLLVDVHFWDGTEGMVATLDVEDMGSEDFMVRELIEWKVPGWLSREVAKKFADEGWATIWQVMGS